MLESVGWFKNFTKILPWRFLICTINCNWLISVQRFDRSIKTEEPVFPLTQESLSAHPHHQPDKSSRNFYQENHTTSYLNQAVDDSPQHMHSDMKKAPFLQRRKHRRQFRSNWNQCLVMCAEIFNYCIEKYFLVNLNLIRTLCRAKF